MLDIGAGIATPLHMLKKLGLNVVGTEISTEAIDKAKNLYGIGLLYGRVEDLGFEENSSEVITLWHVFEHLPYAGKTLAFFRSLLKKGGLIFLGVPNNSYWQRFYNPKFLLSCRQKKLESIVPQVAYDKPFSEIHLIHFTPRSLGENFAGKGFAVQEMNMDNISLRPGIIKDIKYAFRNFVADHFKIFTHEALFVCAKRE